MHNTPIDLLSIERGTVTAPAGCGKTHLIAEALTCHTGPKPVLVLTHTNAGVAALRSRLANAGVPTSAFRLMTIDGWVIRLLSMFPERSGANASLLQATRPSYPKIRDAACGLLKESHLDDIIAANYDRLIVDEYQDCSVPQHAIVFYAARVLRTVVLGDPMQAIFNWPGNEVAPWNDMVCKHFPLVAELDIPWRWKNAGSEELGQWLLNARSALANRKPVDLRAAPPSVQWIELDGSDDYSRQLEAARTTSPEAGGSVLVIGNSKKPQSHRDFAARTPGAITVENVDLRDVTEFAADFDINDAESLEKIIRFAANVMTNVGPDDFVKRVKSLQSGTARNEPNEAEVLALEFSERPSFARGAALLSGISRMTGVRVFRNEVLRVCLKALNQCDKEEVDSLYEAAVRFREQSRILGREVPNRAIGSTLLLKGLEADVSVVLDAAHHDAKSLYVAMTRGSRKLVVCSKTPVLNQ